MSAPPAKRQARQPDDSTPPEPSPVIDITDPGMQLGFYTSSAGLDARAQARLLLATRTLRQNPMTLESITTRASGPVPVASIETMPSLTDMVCQSVEDLENWRIVAAANKIPNLKRIRVEVPDGMEGNARLLFVDRLSRALWATYNTNHRLESFELIGGNEAFGRIAHGQAAYGTITVALTLFTSLHLPEWIFPFLRLTETSAYPKLRYFKTRALPLGVDFYTADDVLERVRRNLHVHMPALEEFHIEIDDGIEDEEEAMDALARLAEYKLPESVTSLAITWNMPAHPLPEDIVVERALNDLVESKTSLHLSRLHLQVSCDQFWEDYSLYPKDWPRLRRVRTNLLQYCPELLIDFAEGQLELLTILNDGYYTRYIDLTEDTVNALQTMGRPEHVVVYADGVMPPQEYRQLELQRLHRLVGPAFAAQMPTLTEAMDVVRDFLRASLKTRVFVRPGTGATGRFPFDMMT